MSDWNSDYPDGNGESYADHFFGEKASHETFLKALFGEDLTNPNENLKHIAKPLRVNDNKRQQFLENNGFQKFLEHGDYADFIKKFKIITYKLACALPNLAFDCKGYPEGYRQTILLAFGRRDNARNMKRFGQICYSNDDKIFSIESRMPKGKNINWNDHRDQEFKIGQDLENFEKEFKDIIEIIKKNHFYNERPHFINNEASPPYYPANIISKPKEKPSGITEHKPHGNSEPMQSLNQILYGPPGTGKTYNTVTKALEIIDKNITYPDYSKQLTRFNELKAEGRIAFITFHQSFSYEDFIEGIRAETDNKGNLRYSVKDGVFKKIAIDALFNKLSDDEIKIAWQIVLEKDKDSEKKLSELYKNNNEHKELILSEIKLSDYKRGIDEHNNLIHEPYVLIIDEINRGNISRIFGELITLIETTKRAGSDEAMDAVLPYSQEKFTVPDNLYIIGTMNTADRSLAQIDIALRRRFDFIEKMPEPTKIKDKDGKPCMVGKINVQDMLTRINQNIEALYDREHTIGHAFFMRLKDNPTIEELASIFKNNVLPLLEEYFFEDWEKITKVLGDSKIYVPNDDINNLKLGNNKESKCYKRDYSALESEQTYLDIIKD